MQSTDLTSPAEYKSCDFSTVFSYTGKDGDNMDSKYSLLVNIGRIIEILLQGGVLAIFVTIITAIIGNVKVTEPANKLNTEMGIDKGSAILIAKEQRTVYAKKKIQSLSLLLVITFFLGVVNFIGIFQVKDVFGDDTVYFGKTVANKAEGYGLRYDKDRKLIYSGHFLANEYEGKGTLFYIEDWTSKPMVYIGDFKDGKREGHGKEYYITEDENGNSFLMPKYDGEYKNDKYHGYGVLYSWYNTGNIECRGQFSNGYIEGLAKLYFNGNIDIYEGPIYTAPHCGGVRMISYIDNEGILQ